MSNESILPRRIIQLAEALQPAQQQLAAKLEEKFYPHQRSIQTSDAANSIYRVMNEIAHLCPLLTRWVDTLMTDIIQSDAGP